MASWGVTFQPLPALYSLEVVRPTTLHLSYLRQTLLGLQGLPQQQPPPCHLCLQVVQGPLQLLYLGGYLLSSKVPSLYQLVSCVHHHQGHSLVAVNLTLQVL